MVITDGAVFSEELRNSSSLQFKSLAFDVQQLVRAQAFILKENRQNVLPASGHINRIYSEKLQTDLAPTLLPFILKDYRIRSQQQLLF